MTLPADWWTTDLEDAPCDGCGVRPSKHAGHGSFTCESCYAKWWCPECKYMLGPDHVCPTSEQRAADEKEYQAFLLDMDLGGKLLDYLDEVGRVFGKEERQSELERIVTAFGEKVT